jgi:hypothetical protein
MSETIWSELCSRVMCNVITGLVKPSLSNRCRELLRKNPIYKKRRKIKRKESHRKGIEKGKKNRRDCGSGHLHDRVGGRLRLKCDGTRAETRFRLSAKRTSPFKSAGASVQSTTGSRGVRISGSNAGYTMFRGSVKSTDYPLHSSVFPSLPLPCVTVCHHISTGLC